MKTKIKSRIKKHKNLYVILSSLYHVLTFFKIIIFKISSILLYFFPIKERILISNFGGKGFFDNPKYLVKGLRDKNNDIEILWLVNDLNEDFPSELNIKKIKNNFVNQLFYLSTSSIWIDTFRKAYIPIKKKDQIYIQFWHGGLGFKKVEYGKDIKLIHKFSTYFDNKAIDVMISNSEHLTKIYRQDFKYDKTILKLGYPMNDKLFQKVDKLESEHFKILYVPTFRGNEIKGKIPSYFPDFHYILSKIERIIPNIKLIIRPHPSLELSIKDLYSDPRIIDGFDYSDVKDLIVSSDLVISDYSSTIFDCLIIDKPGIIFAKDYKKYLQDNGTYYTFDILPFNFCLDETCLVDSIISVHSLNFKEEYQRFLKIVQLRDDGNSTKRVSNFLLDVIENGKTAIYSEDYDKYRE